MYILPNNISNSMKTVITHTAHTHTQLYIYIYSKIIIKNTQRNISIESFMHGQWLDNEKSKTKFRHPIAQNVDKTQFDAYALISELPLLRRLGRGVCHQPYIELGKFWSCVPSPTEVLWYNKSVGLLCQYIYIYIEREREDYFWHTTQRTILSKAYIFSSHFILFYF